MNKKKIAITIGDPAGIGPEIIIKTLLSVDNHDDFILIGNKDIFHHAAYPLGFPLPESIEIIDIPCDISKIKTGEPSIESGRLSFLALETACNMAKDKKINAIVTAPISKTAINMAGYHYSGQTEILQEYLGKEQNLKSEMLFVSKDFRVLLLTRHIKLADVSSVLTIEKAVESITALYKSLKTDFNVQNPKLAICGLNPHAGEDGLLGSEEQEILIPVIKHLKAQNINIDGPFPADTVWIKAAKPYVENTTQPYDAYIACYHDQGLIPVKLLAMDKAVNVTINLPIIRTSPSHGTAYDIAGKNLANHNSMLEAINLANDIASKFKHYSTSSN